MKLKRLINQIHGLEIKGSKEIEITGLSAHSKSVAPGNLFVAKRGKTHDGTEFISDAVRAGASCILTDIYDPFLMVTQLIHEDIPSIEAKLAAQFYNNPSQDLEVVGVTGTNGKTTVSFLVKHLFDRLHTPTGLVGTVEWIVGDHRFPSSMTTPDAITSQKLLHDMLHSGQKTAVLEVSSHGLDQGRALEIDFDFAVFTNLAEDHLDYHKDKVSYQKAKEKLFTSLSPEKWAIFNGDDPTKFQTKANRFTYGIEKSADLTAKNIELADKSTKFQISYQGKELSFKIGLVGKFNVYNVLAAVSVGLCRGFSLEECAKALKTFKQIPGRMEKVSEGIFVDFAHSEDALKNVLDTLNEVKKGRLITVFGCGGDRDRSKRAKMGKIASKLSDMVILTNDNPRTEDPEKIIEDILEGFESAPRIQLDREEAIRFALEEKEENDLVLIAGKGHEKEQILGDQTIPFDDREVVEGHV